MNNPRGRPFQPGNTIGRGRPQGSRNKSKSPSQELFDEYSPHLTRKCIALAMNGNPVAMRICMDRLVPYVNLNLPVIRKAQDLDKAAEKVMQATKRGKITPADGGKLMNILESRGRIIERTLLESRVEKLEERIGLTDPSLTP